MAAEEDVVASVDFGDPLACVAVMCMRDAAVTLLCDCGCFCCKFRKSLLTLFLTCCFQSIYFELKFVTSLQIGLFKFF